MMLASLQRLFTEALLYDHDSNELSVQLDNKRRLFIYQNNVFGQLIEALGSTYSTVKALIGDECFAAIAREFCQSNPPEEASLIYYGASFPEFVSAHKALQNLAYIGDVARFEWAWNKAFFAEDSDYLNPASLQSLTETELENLVLIPHPSLSILKLHYPAHTLWAWVENGANEPAPEIKNERHSLIIFRAPSHEVCILPIAEDEMISWQAIVAAKPLCEVLHHVPLKNQGRWLEKVLTSSMLSSS
jgi:hypothetical protein